MKDSYRRGSQSNQAAVIVTLLLGPSPLTPFEISELATGHFVAVGWIRLAVDNLSNHGVIEPVGERVAHLRGRPYRWRLTPAVTAQTIDPETAPAAIVKARVIASLAMGPLSRADLDTVVAGVRPCARVRDVLSNLQRRAVTRRGKDGLWGLTGRPADLVSRSPWKSPR